MLVYGDPKFTATTAEVRLGLDVLLAGNATRDLDFWRMFLIRAGQLEQALADLDEPPSTKAFAGAAQRVTDQVARIFYRKWCSDKFSASAEMIQELRQRLA